MRPRTKPTTAGPVAADTSTGTPATVARRHPRRRRCRVSASAHPASSSPALASTQAGIRRRSAAWSAVGPSAMGAASAACTGPSPPAAPAAGGASEARSAISQGSAKGSAADRSTAPAHPQRVGLPRASMARSSATEPRPRSAETAVQYSIQVKIMRRPPGSPPALLLVS